MSEVWAFNGRTELAAATEVLRSHGVEPTSEAIDVFLELLVAEYHERYDDLAGLGRALPGAAEALEAVAAVTGAHQSVLTGNIYPLAVIKLRAFGLDASVDFRIGAYGGDAYERTDLPAYAFDRTERHLGRRYSGADTTIIGDTVRDIEAARFAGARAIGVATGRTSADDLARAGADAVLADLSDTGAVLAAIANQL
jgi:phosphoglycolate phosphatase-like HAD superfamily hydrolase